MLIEKISDEEISLIENYRRNYAYNENSYNCHDNFISTKEILKVWENAKGEYLYKLFDTNLTLTKHLNFTKSFEELSEEFDCMMDGVSQFGRAGRSGNSFSDKFVKLMRTKPNFENLFGDSCDNVANELLRLVYNETLINNRYDGDDIDIPLPNGKMYKVRNGCKPMRALNKIAEIFHLDGFEDFRICHSQILNQKDIGGDLTISIHPLDYMTMSDNTCGWDSCMSWYNEGGYRQGTVEMMNSKCVVVAYLSAEEPMNMYPGTWSNKKWRQLFIVDKNAILGIKGYPYQNDDLTCAVLEWLRELVKEKLGWTYGNIVKTNNHNNPIVLPNGERVNIRLETGQMYNDWGCLENHCGLFNMNISIDDLKHVSYCDEYYYNIDYSGRSQCMVCGQTDLDTSFADESALACTCCQDSKVCDCCGEYIYGDEYYVIDDMMLCESCYEERVAECAACEEEHHVDYMHQIYVIPRWTPEEMDELRQRIIEREKDPKYRYYNHKDHYDMPEMVTINTDYPQFSVCDDSECLNEFCNKYLKDGCRPHVWEVEYARYTCVYWDDLKEDVKDEVYYPVDKYKSDAFDEKGSFQLRFAHMVEQI